MPTHLDRRTLYLDPEKEIAMHFRYLKGGLARIGQRGIAEPVHDVMIAPFWMAETPVTQEQFKLFDDSHENHFGGKPSHPAEKVDWHAANLFCKWLGHDARLPTEAEWEYACRAGTETEYSSGDGAAALTQVAWFDEDLDHGSTQSVCGKPANAFKLYDMHGNVWEWCFDTGNQDVCRSRIDGDPDSKMKERETTDPAKVAKESIRVLRGGSWFDSARVLPLRLPQQVPGRQRLAGTRRFPGLSAPRSGGAEKQPSRGRRRPGSRAERERTAGGSHGGRFGHCHSSAA